MGDTIVGTKSELNVLAIRFDSRLNWSHQVNETAIRANKALDRIKLLR